MPWSQKKSVDQKRQKHNQHNSKTKPERGRIYIFLPKSFASAYRFYTKNENTRIVYLQVRRADFSAYYTLVSSGSRK